MLGAFLQLTRESRSPGSRAPQTGPIEPLMARTCEATMDSVAKTFNAAGFPDPRHNDNGKVAHLLRRQIRGYTNVDPGTRHQKCLSFQLLCDMVERQLSEPIFIAFHQLMLLSFFFAMRSRETFRVAGDRRTEPICLLNLIFRQDHKIVPHHCSPTLEHSDSITVVFEFQKRDKRNDQVTQNHSSHPWRCPVKAAAAIVRRLQQFNAPEDTFIHMYQNDTTNQITPLNSQQALTLLRTYIASIDHQHYGISPKDIGLHSLQSSAAMAMVLNGVPTYIVQILGCWSSLAFLRYIRKQVEEFGQDVSKQMIKTPTYHHVADANALDPRTHDLLSATANPQMDLGRANEQSVFDVWG